MIYNIPDTGWFRIQDSTADVVYCGYLDNNNVNKVLNHIKIGFLKHDCLGKFKVRLHTSTNFNRVYAESSIVDFDDIDDDLFYGNIRFDFVKGVNLGANNRYYVTIQATEYTRVGNTKFVGWLHDRVSTTNNSTGNWDNEFPIKMEYFGK